MSLTKKFADLLNKRYDRAGFTTDQGGLGTQLRRAHKKTVTFTLSTTAASTSYYFGHCWAAAGKIVAIWAGALVVPAYATATAALNNYDSTGAADRNPLAATTLDLTALTAKTPVSFALGLPSKIGFKKGDFMYGTLAIGGTESVVGQAVTLTVEYELD